MSADCCLPSLLAARRTHARTHAQFSAQLTAAAALLCTRLLLSLSLALIIRRVRRRHRLLLLKDGEEGKRESGRERKRGDVERRATLLLARMHRQPRGLIIL